MKHPRRMAGVAAIVGALLFAPYADATPLKVNSDLSIEGKGLVVAFGGVGLESFADGGKAISVDIRGPIQMAALYWAGRDLPCPQDGGLCVISEPYKDQELLFDGNSILGEVIGWEQSSSTQGLINNVGYRADVTEIVRPRGPGSHIFTIEDGNPDSNFGAGLSGASLLILYTDSADPNRYALTVFEGLDLAWGNADEPHALDAAPVKFSYLPTGEPRLADLYVAVGDAEPDRLDRIEITGNAHILNQLDGSAGPRWDSDTFAVIVPPGTDSISADVVSPSAVTAPNRALQRASAQRAGRKPSRATESDPDSLLWQLAVLRIPVPELGCTPGEPCDDGNLCTADDLCTETGECVGTSIDPTVECNDGNPCTIDICDPIEGCLNAPEAGASCDDGDACTDGDACDADGRCVGTPIQPALDCDDGNACTLDSCNPHTGCVNVAKTGVGCDDGDPCTAADVCDRDGRCSGTPIDPIVACDDENICTIELCDPAVGCVNEPDVGGICDDGDACTVDDACDAKGVCVGTPIDPAVFCDDGNACTVETCDPASGCASAPDIGASCDDGDPCTTATCNAAGECVGTAFDPAIACDDGNPCTVDSCDPAVGCVNTPNEGAPCDDGSRCTIDACNANGICVGTPFDPTIVCDDGNSCTIDICDRHAGCVNVPHEDAECDDADACTADDCDSSGVCVSTPIDPAVECDDGNECTADSCDPAVGCVNTPMAGAECSDGDACTTDICDADGICVSTPIDPAVMCDDRADCTLDTCDPVVGCRNININTLECEEPEDCPLAATDCVDGFCLCDAPPSLCLEPVKVVSDPPPPEGCGFEEGAPLDVVVRMGFSKTPICAAQFFLAYDVEALELVEVVPGGGVFEATLFESSDMELGTIDYIVGAAPGGVCLGTNGPEVVATLRFNAIVECNTPVWFRSNNPPTRLGAADGSEVCPDGHFDIDGVCGNLVDPCDTGELIIDSTPPEFINCPEIDAGMHADCGNVTKLVNWDPVQAIDNCDGTVAVECTVSNSRGYFVGSLGGGGGLFPVGDNTVTCVARDTCGNTSECEFVVSNSGMNALHLDIELSPTFSPGPLIRGIEVVAGDCREVPRPHTTCVDATFGSPDNLPDHSTVQIPVPPAYYQCAQVRDPLHTLSSACGLECTTIPGEGQVWYGTFHGAEGPEGSCHWLINGNLNGVEPDGQVRIDILDYVAFVSALTEQPVPSPDSPCGFTAIHADINGDGSVDHADFAYVAENLFRHDRAGCDSVCNDIATAPESIVMQDQISVRHLADMGYLRAGRLADLNHDGVVDLTDLSLYANGDSAPAADPLDLRMTGRNEKRTHRPADLP